MVALLLALAAATAKPPPIVFDANRWPQFYGEIYRVDPDGTRTDVSRSAAADVAPAVSPDGKRVAFASDRSGKLAIYVVGIDGHGLRRVSPLLFVTPPSIGDAVQIAWAPNGRTLAVSVWDPLSTATSSTLFLDDLHGGWRPVSTNATADAAQATWSPNGHYLAFLTRAGEVEVTDANGKKLWSASGEPEIAWSAHDLLAVQALSNTIRVYGARGRSISSFGGRDFAWSPTGGTLAYQAGKHIALRHVTGTPFLTIPIWGSAQWIDSTRLAISGTSGWVAYDLAGHTTSPLPNTGVLVTSPTGALAAETGTDLVLTRVGAATQVVARGGPCGDDDQDFGDVQFVGRTRSLVYQSGCWNAPADIYAVNADGTGLRNVTKSPSDESQPSVSPDGTEVAYAVQDAMSCKGCNQSLSVIPLAGGTAVQLTNEEAQSALVDDEYPSWSRDGKQVVFVHGTGDGPSHLFEIPEQGGTMRDLGIKAGYDAVMGPKLIAYFGSSATLAVKTLDPATGAVKTVSAGAKLEQGSSLAWSRSGRLAYLAWPHGAPSIVVVGGRTIALAPLLPAGSHVQGLAWSPDGTRFAFTATDANGVGDVYTIGAGGTHLTQVTHDVGALGSVSWR